MIISAKGTAVWRKDQILEHIVKQNMPAGKTIVRINEPQQERIASPMNTKRWDAIGERETQKAIASIPMLVESSVAQREELNLL